MGFNTKSGSIFEWFGVSPSDFGRLQIPQTGFRIFIARSGTTGPRQEPWEAQLAKVLGPATVDGFCELDDRWW